MDDVFVDFPVKAGVSEKHCIARFSLNYVGPVVRIQGAKLVLSVALGDVSIHIRRTPSVSDDDGRASLEQNKRESIPLLLPLPSSFLFLYYNARRSAAISNRSKGTCGGERRRKWENAAATNP